MNCKQITLHEWEAALPETGFEVFHTPAALTVLNKHSPGDLQLFAGYNGDRPVGLFPVVVDRRNLGTVIHSPPPAMGIHRLGPLLMPASPKRRKQEKLNREFVTETLDKLDFNTSLTVLRTICPASYTDPRPYIWNGLSVNTAFTYSLDTTNMTNETLKKSFSKSLRREIRDAENLDIYIQKEETDTATRIHEETQKRYAEQDQQYPLTRSYVEDLTSTLAADNRCRVYSARSSNGEFLSGITTLYSNDAAYFWQGGNRTVYDGVSINSLLHWQILKDIINDPPRESVTNYDLMGANTERLCRYKSKFGADLVPYYIIESGGRAMDLAKKAYRILGR